MKKPAFEAGFFVQVPFTGAASVMHPLVQAVEERQRHEGQTYPVKIVISKMRHGRVGSEDLLFNWAYQRFMDPKELFTPWKPEQEVPFADE